MMHSTASQRLSAIGRPFSMQSLMGAEMTPPLTPAISSEDLTSQDIKSTSTHFPTYLRAIYPFHPACDADSDTVTLPLNQGDIILVHSVHSNGWADGTLLDTAHRGWLPTNYCEEYDSEPIRMLLNALTSFWDSANEGGDGTVPMIHGHNLTQGLVAGVRYLLAATECLDRDCELLSKTLGHAGVRRHRKALLSDLAELVRFFKSCQQTTNDTYLSEEVLSHLVLRTFKIIVRAVKFHDVWSQLQEATKSNMMHNIPVLQTPTSETTSFSSTQSSSDSIVQDALPQFAGNAGMIHDDPQPQQIVYTRNRDSSLRSSLQTPKCLQHRISWSVANKSNGKLASSRLMSAHESFLSFMGIFLSIHLITQTATEVLVATQQAVNSGRALLTVVEAVWDRGLCKSKLLEQARDEMYSKITQLVFAAQQIFASSDASEEENTTRKELSDAALTCVKSATDCINATRAALELIGDFEFETIEESSFSGVDFESQAFEPSRDSADYTLVQDFPLPPERNVPTPPLENDLTPTHIATKMIATISEAAIYDETVPNTPSSRLSVSSILQAPPSLTDGSSFGDASPLSMSSDNIASFPPRKQSLDLVTQTSRLSLVSQVKTNEAWSVTTLNRSESSTNLTDTNSSVDHSLLDGDLEEEIMQTTYVHELIYNKDGQISGGTLPALVERLTTSDSRPDHVFLSSFFLTFRLFTEPSVFATALITRYHYIGDFKTSAPVVRLRIYNVFKTWLESNWRKETDTSALEIIKTFAQDDLISAYPSASARLLELVANVSGEKTTRSLMSKASVEQMAKLALPAHAPVPDSVLNKSQKNLLASWQQGSSKPLITDFEPLEIARQLTLKASALFCAIQPEELLACEWTKKSGSHATNVRAMSTLSTDLTNLVAETVLQYDEHAKRAKVIKHWIKVASKCLVFNNYDSLMAIVCSLNSTPILRLKKTWDCVSSKAKAAFDQFHSIVDCSKNYTTLRQRLASLVTPAIPFLGVYLTDLTFVEAGNATTRNLPGTPTSNAIAAINFDKHAKTAKIIFELQRFQVPYHLQEIAEFQAWLQDQFVQVRCSLDNGSSPITKLYRRSCILEPRENQTTNVLPSGKNKSQFMNLYFS